MADWFGTQGDIARYLDTGSTSSVGPLGATVATGASPMVANATGIASGLSFAASGIASAIGAYNASSAQKRAYKYQAQIQGINAQIGQWQASAAIIAGQNKEEMSGLHTGEVYATQRATMAANGVDLSEGSAIDVLASTRVVGDINAAAIKTDALNQAWGYQVQAVNASNNGRLYNAAAKDVNPNVSAATSLLTSATGAASKWYSMTSTGAI